MGEEQLNERRRFKRVDVCFWVEYTVNSALFVQMNFGSMATEAQALDLSEGGIAILSTYSIPPESIVTLRFNISNSATAVNKDMPGQIKVDGEVRYSLPVPEKNLYRLGINFIDLSAEDRKFIADFVARTIKTNKEP